MLNRYYNPHIVTFETYFVDVYNLPENYYCYCDHDLDRDLGHCDSASFFLNSHGFDCDFFYVIKS